MLSPSSDEPFVLAAMRLVEPAPFSWLTRTNLCARVLWRYQLTISFSCPLLDLVSCVRLALAWSNRTLASCCSASYFVLSADEELMAFLLCTTRAFLTLDWWLHKWPMKTEDNRAQRRGRTTNFGLRQRTCLCSFILRKIKSWFLFELMS